MILLFWDSWFISYSVSAISFGNRGCGRDTALSYCLQLHRSPHPLARVRCRPSEFTSSLGLRHQRGRWLVLIPLIFVIVSNWGNVSQILSYHCCRKGSCYIPTVYIDCLCFHENWQTLKIVFLWNPPQRCCKLVRLVEQMLWFVHFHTNL